MVIRLVLIIYCKGRMKPPLKPDEQWPLTVAKKKVVLVHSYWPVAKKHVVLVHSHGPQNNDKVKESANEVAVLPRKPSARQGC